MHKLIMVIMATGAAIGGIDKLLGNRFRLGEKFEEGFMLLGPVALSMAGILCLSPLLAQMIEKTIAPICLSIGLDPAMVAGLLAIDMGGYPIAIRVASNPIVGQYSGIMVAAIFGCTVTYTIPVGMGVLPPTERQCFLTGVLYGIIVLPVVLLIGGVVLSLPISVVLRQLTPIMLLSLLLLIGIWKWPEKTVRMFKGFAAILKGLTTIGLMVGAIQYMTGWTIIRDLLPLDEAMGTVASIGIVLLGSLPTAELFQRILKRPFEKAGQLLGINKASIAGLFLSMVSILPMFGIMKDMDRRGKIINAAAAVSSASALSAHLGYVIIQNPALAMPLLAVKLLGGVLAISIVFITQKQQVALEQH